MEEETYLEYLLKTKIINDTLKKLNEIKNISKYHDFKIIIKLGNKNEKIKQP
jgi:hypothetical protein